MIKHVTIFLCMLFVFIGVSAQTKTLTGTVKDANQEPLIGVSIVEKGTSNGTITDLDGNFSIKVNPKSSLVFSYVGYAPQTIVVGSQDHINVVMREDNKELEELVVVGYGVQKKSDVTGSISSVSANDIKGLATTDAGAALQGKASGVQVLNSSGAPGELSKNPYTWLLIQLRTARSVVDCRRS